MSTITRIHAAMMGSAYGSESMSELKDEGFPAPFFPSTP
eukprot:CAMPEP_0173456242 /NCGR_PEP_ID=MMETSP1357-20121228/55687_1 /TAXON_ID=77926 /ORGANISM="Hemiselmis rufescens, Strain PCC563" /LENGTH=38 /DNA_ID= /DNA_START= /DNA_END= /DNA_ORIENTATION=